MNKLRNLFSICLLMIVAFSSCTSEAEKQKEKEAEIRAERTREDKIAAMFNGAENAFAIASIDFNNIIEKSGVNDGVLPLQFQFLMDEFLKYLKDEKMTGIDMSHKLHTFVDTDGATEPEYIIGNLMIKDAESFQAFLEKELDLKVITEDDASFPIAQSRDKQMYVSWGEDGMCLFVNANSRKAAEKGEKYINKLWALQVDSEIDKTVVEYLKKEADISFFVKGDKTTNFIELQADNQSDVEVSEAMNKMAEYTEGSSSSVFVHFNKGNITVKNEINWNEAFIKKFPYLNEGGVNPEILNYLSKDGNAIASGNVAINMDAVWALFDFLMPENEKSKLEGELKSAGVALDMLKSAISGDIAFALTDFSFPTNEEGSYDQSKDEVLFSFAFSTKNSAVVKELLQAQKEIQGADGLYSMKEINYVVTDKYFVVTTDKNLAQSIHNGKLTPLNMRDFNDELTASNINAVHDFDALNKSLEGLQMDEVGQVTKMFDYVTFKADLNSSEFILYLKNKDQNSLRIITEKSTEGLSEMMM